MVKIWQVLILVLVHLAFELEKLIGPLEIRIILEVIYKIFPMFLELFRLQMI